MRARNDAPASPPAEAAHPISPHARAIAEAVAFAGVSIGLAGRQVLGDVGFSIPPGAFVGVLGPNGAGKTTLMRAILGLVPIGSGEIRVLGAPPRRGNRSIGYLPQSRGPMPASLTGIELLHASSGGHGWGWPLVRRAERQAVEAALAWVGAADLARRPIGELSGGERQRLFIAQTLIGEPELLLLDEPLAGLDPARQHAILRLVAKIARERNIAVLLSAHELNPLLPVIDTVLYLGNGQAAVGTVNEVVRPEVLRRIYGSPVDVIRASGRIFVTAESGPADGHLHADDERGAA